MSKTNPANLAWLRDFKTDPRFCWQSCYMDVATSSGMVSVTIASTLASGAYHLLACADELNAVAESNESHNCEASSGHRHALIGDRVPQGLGAGLLRA